VGFHIQATQTGRGSAQTEIHMWNIWKKRCHKVFHKWGLQHRQLQELIRQDLQQWQAAGRRHWGAPDCNHVSLTAYETCLGYRALVSSTGLVVLFYFLFLLFWLLYICSFFYLMQSAQQPPSFLKKRITTNYIQLSNVVLGLI
jgi:thiosulfate reductase cytochrome b subunit